MNYTKTPYWSIKTPEQYVRYLVNVNKGTDSPVLKNKLIEYAHTLDVSVDPKMTKNEIFEAIIEKKKIRMKKASLNQKPRKKLPRNSNWVFRL